MKNNKNNLHETQTSRMESVSSFHPLFEDAQRIEGGGVPQKVIWHTLPKGIRVIGYIFTGLVVAMLLIALSTNFY
ncbi:hypothetical protein [Paenibacillus paridis]|uniref:hypothetical protein n=1 Tax=Paenibacillus paridis TaxID=2583376 RepID=UPI00111D34F7|nr:hypothetical protein [Paenibacillus paridis]